MSCLKLHYLGSQTRMEVTVAYCGLIVLSEGGGLDLHETLELSCLRKGLAKPT